MSVELTGFLLILRQLECALGQPLPDDAAEIAACLRPACERQVQRLTGELVVRGLYVRSAGLLLRADAVREGVDVRRLH
jgi:hypothetical protein